MSFNRNDVIFLSPEEHAARKVKGMKPTLFYCKSELRNNQAPVHTLLEIKTEQPKSKDGLPGKKIHRVIADSDAPAQAPYSIPSASIPFQSTVDSSAKKGRFAVPESKRLSEEPPLPTQQGVASSATPFVEMDLGNPKDLGEVSTFRKIRGIVLISIGVALCAVSYASTVSGMGWPFSLIGAEVGKYLMATGAACLGLGSMQEMYDYFCGCFGGESPKNKLQPKNGEESSPPTNAPADEQSLVGRSHSLVSKVPGKSSNKSPVVQSSSGSAFSDDEPRSSDISSSSSENELGPSKMSTPHTMHATTPAVKKRLSNGSSFSRVHPASTLASTKASSSSVSYSSSNGIQPTNTAAHLVIGEFKNGDLPVVPIDVLLQRPPSSSVSLSSVSDVVSPSRTNGTQFSPTNGTSSIGTKCRRVPLEKVSNGRGGFRSMIKISH